ncbi:hypothetical protein BDB00DRAFT_545082 [Zychaea mexicana]|uniref:uncharacterized protein n=1 Tax=Zychaea mexicana TaxID=64656 RepID=UPI0022FE1F17|nr:uncharacterized protein BDB00DRAFT_545082 [Zychaea mexicana]KAI9497902.1 hypothetical protein BDB00DRAFT_545082 [Zychaea mexicana]
MKRGLRRLSHTHTAECGFGLLKLMRKEKTHLNRAHIAPVVMYKKKNPFFFFPLFTFSPIQMSQQNHGLLYRRFTAQAESSPPVLHDAAGNDFKRLLEKARNKDNATAAPSASPLPSPPSTTSTTEAATAASATRIQKQPVASPIRAHGFAVGEPIILPLPPNYKRRAPGVLDKVYDWLFEHEDRYFNTDRNELSQDIFPVTDHRNSVQRTGRKKLYSSP